MKNDDLINSVELIVNKIVETYSGGFCFGMVDHPDALHIAGELVGRFLKETSFSVCFKFGCSNFKL